MQSPPTDLSRNSLRLVDDSPRDRVIKAKVQEMMEAGATRSEALKYLLYLGVLAATSGISVEIKE